MIIAGLDIGGTKCAVSIAKVLDDQVEILEKMTVPTPDTPEKTIKFFVEGLQELMKRQGIDSLRSIGISSGGPLDSEKGLILSPPNLPGWDCINIVSPLKEVFDVPILLQNDANASALAEWRWGVGKGTSNMIFLTFGTGMGAGLILNGRLYSGTNGMAGEVGHIRLEEQGPEGYGKRGSFEGFCSGGGIARLAKEKLAQQDDQGAAFLRVVGKVNLSSITAKDIGEAAALGNDFALEIIKITGQKLGRALSILIDVLNPEKIIIGSIYTRQRELLEPHVMEMLKKEALPESLKVCKVEPSKLGEQVGDYASLSVAMEVL